MIKLEIMSLRFYFLTGILSLVLCGTTFANIPNDTKATAEVLTNLSNWCSGSNAYTTVGATGSY
uniref:hypothetical protein n=1 Tax=Fulvivirga sp. TaxID=1931237 RepID=UPI00404B06A2